MRHPAKGPGELRLYCCPCVHVSDNGGHSKSLNRVMVPPAFEPVLTGGGLATRGAPAPSGAEGGHPHHVGVRGDPHGGRWGDTSKGGRNTHAGSGGSAPTGSPTPPAPARSTERPARAAGTTNESDEAVSGAREAAVRAPPLHASLPHRPPAPGAHRARQPGAASGPPRCHSDPGPAAAVRARSVQRSGATGSKRELRRRVPDSSHPPHAQAPRGEWRVPARPTPREGPRRWEAGRGPWRAGGEAAKAPERGPGAPGRQLPERTRRAAAQLSAAPDGPGLGAAQAGAGVSLTGGSGLLKGGVGGGLGMHEGRMGLPGRCGGAGAAPAGVLGGTRGCTRRASPPRPSIANGP